MRLSPVACRTSPCHFLAQGGARPVATVMPIQLARPNTLTPLLPLNNRSPAPPAPNDFLAMFALLW